MQDLMIPRRRRRTLLRTTAPPTRLEVIKPTLAEDTSSVLRSPTRMRLAWIDFPCSRTFAKSLVSVRRADLGKRCPTESGFCVSGEVDLDTFWK